jgi:hypothetical protein
MCIHIYLPVCISISIYLSIILEECFVENKHDVIRMMMIVMMIIVLKKTLETKGWKILWWDQLKGQLGFR